MDEQRTQRQLAAIGEVANLAEELGIDLWLRGGWAVDFFLGQITRVHEDIDWFAWGSDSSVLLRALREHGFAQIAGPPVEQQIDVLKDTLEHSFALIAVNETGTVVVNGGPWKGEPWPTGLLSDASPRQLGGVRCNVISPDAQVEIKEMTPIWIPGRPRRSKDRMDIARIKNALSRGTDTTV